MSDFDDSLPRRALMTLLGVGALGAGPALAAPTEPATAEPRATPPVGGRAEPWHPALEPQDDWMELPGRHRFLLDATSASGAGEALGFAGTYFTTNQQAYKLAPSDLAVMIVLRHLATPFGYADVIWAKYGEQLSRIISFTDPRTALAPAANLYDAKAPVAGLSSRGTTLSSLIKKGARFAVCGAATQALSGMLAKEGHGDAAAIHAELVANLIPNAHLVPAGIVAVNRAQERGYALGYVG